jgi:hypothetical protein
MIASLLFAVLAFTFLLLLLARYARSPRLLAAERDTALFGRGPRITPEQLRALWIELCAAMGIETSVAPGDERRLDGQRNEPLRSVRYVFFLEPEPPGDVLDAATILDVRETARAEGALGVLVTPYEIDRTGLPALDDGTVELVDGERLRGLVQLYLPDRAADVARYRGFGARVSTPRPLTPRPV